MKPGGTFGYEDMPKTDYIFQHQFKKWFETGEHQKISWTKDIIILADHMLQWIDVFSSLI